MAQSSSCLALDPSRRGRTSVVLIDRSCLPHVGLRWESQCLPATDHQVPMPPALKAAKAAAKQRAARTPAVKPKVAARPKPRSRPADTENLVSEDEFGPDSPDEEEDAASPGDVGGSQAQRSCVTVPLLNQAGGKQPRDKNRLVGSIPGTPGPANPIPGTPRGPRTRASSAPKGQSGAALPSSGRDKKTVKVLSVATPCGFCSITFAQAAAEASRNS